MPLGRHRLLSPWWRCCTAGGTPSVPWHRYSSTVRCGGPVELTTAPRKRNSGTFSCIRFSELLLFRVLGSSRGRRNNYSRCLAEPERNSAERVGKRWPRGDGLAEGLGLEQAAPLSLADELDPVPPRQETHVLPAAFRGSCGGSPSVALHSGIEAGPHLLAD